MDVNSSLFNGTSLPSFVACARGPRSRQQAPTQLPCPSDFSCCRSRVYISPVLFEMIDRPLFCFTTSHRAAENVIVAYTFNCTLPRMLLSIPTHIIMYCLYQLLPLSSITIYSNPPHTFTPAPIGYSRLLLSTLQASCT